MSLSEARRFADAPFALHIAPDARIAKAAAVLAKSTKPEDDARKLRVSAEQITRVWEKATAI